jgi:hypothetical protein
MLITLHDSPLANRIEEEMEKLVTFLLLLLLLLLPSSNFMDNN